MPPKMQEDIQVSVARIEVLLGEHVKREENMWEKINDKIDKFVVIGVLIHRMINDEPEEFCYVFV